LSWPGAIIAKSWATTSALASEVMAVADAIAVTIAIAQVPALGSHGPLMGSTSDLLQACLFAIATDLLRTILHLGFHEALF